MKLRGLVFAIIALGIFACTSNVNDEGSEDKDTTEQELRLKRAGQACGAVTCGVGLVCCNASCGTCVKPGSSCTQQVCNPAR